MLRTWNVENINQGQRALGGGSKARKALGETGSVSENPPPAAAGKGALLSDPRGNKQQRRPLGDRSENVLPSAPGKGGRPVSDSKPKQQQRRALGDISNAGNGPAGAGSGNNGSNLLSRKKSVSGLKFSVHSDPRKQGAVGTGKASATSTTTSGGGGIASKHAKAGAGAGVGVAGGEGEGFAKKRAFFVDDIEMTMGRTGDEEEVLVQRRAEERAARSTNPFKTATVLSQRPRKPSLPVPVSSAAPVGAMETPVDAGASRDRVAVAGPSPTSPPSMLLSSLGSDDGSQITIDRKQHDNSLEDTGILRLTNDAKGQSELDFLADEDLEPDWLTIPADDLNTTPLSPLDDSFLTQELELTFK